MSKLIKGMEIEALRKDFKNVKDMVFLEVQGITAQNNIGAAAGHVRGDRNGAKRSGLGNDLRFGFVITRIEHRMRNTGHR